MDNFDDNIEYLAFVDELSETVEGKWRYRFDFTYDSDTCWGNFFNICPSIIVPNLQPDTNCICSSVIMTFPEKMNVAKKNACFSMQDCIDGIIPMCFSDIKSKKIMVFNFADTYDNVIEKIKDANVIVHEKIYNAPKTDMIDNLINNIENE